MNFAQHKAIGSLRECPDCGAFSHLPDLEPHTRACCDRCGYVLHRYRPRAIDKSLAWTIAGLIFYWLTVTLPFISVHLSGQVRFCTLLTGPGALVDAGFVMMGIVVFMFSIAMPLAKLGLMLIVLLKARCDCPPAWLPGLYRTMKFISPWAMVEVYMLGLFIAYTRLIALAQVDLDVAVYALIGQMVCTAAADTMLDSETIWLTLQSKKASCSPEPAMPCVDEEGAGLVGCHGCHAVNHQNHSHCWRCGTPVHARKVNSVRRCWALLLAAAMLYIPANTFPVMSTVKVGRELSHTILGGADELLEAGLWPLALLVFVASILVPMLKFTSLAFMLITIHRKTDWRIIGRTRLYRFIDFIGRWSMIDVFMISILVALMQFGQLAQVTSGDGAAAFAAVVILTMFATEAFDPRLMWDACGDNDE